jgi:hypothetical protein
MKRFPIWHAVFHKYFVSDSIKDITLYHISNYHDHIIAIKKVSLNVNCIPQNEVKILSSYLCLRSNTTFYPSTDYIIFRPFHRVIPSLQQRSYVFLIRKLYVIPCESHVFSQFDVTCQLKPPKFASSSTDAGDFPLFLALGPMSGGICCNSLQAVSNNSKPLSQARADIFPARTTCIAFVINRVVL